MRRQGFYAALLGAGALLAAFAPEAPAGERGISVVRAPTGEALRGDNWLLLVAIGKYREWGNLRGPAKDVTALKKVLHERYAFDAAHTVELHDEKATKKAIIETFRDLGRRLRPEDSLLVYYAGHGHTDEFSKTGYWIPHDAGADTAMQERWLPNAAVRGYLREMKCSHVLLLSDSCFSGDLLDEQRGELPKITDAYFRRAYEMQARQVLTSGGSEPVSDTGLGGRSAFAFHLVRALERNRAPYLDPTQLYVHVRAGVKGQMPLLGSLKGAGHQEGGAYIFFLREGGAKKTPAPPPGGLDLSDLAGQSETRKQWDAWLARMKTDYREVERFVAGSADASVNVKAWQRFADSYAQDDPFSAEDDSLRARAKRELARWRSSLSVGVLSQIETYKAPLPYPRARPTAREPYDLRIMHGKPVPPTLTDTFICDIWQRMGMDLDTKWEGINSQRGDVCEEVVRRAIGIYLTRDWRKIAGYRPWTHWWFLRGLSEQQRKTLVKEVCEYVTVNGIRDRPSDE